MKTIMKRILALILCAALLGGGLPVSAMAAGTLVIRIGTASAAAGGTVEVPVYLDENPGIAGMQLRVSFGNELTLTDVVYTSDTSTGLTSQPSAKLTSPVKLTWYNGTAESFFEGKIAVLHFTVSTDCSSSSIPVTIEADPDDISDLKEENVPFSVENGSVNVTGNSSSHDDPTGGDDNPGGDGSAMTIKVGQETAAPGGTVSVPVTVKDNPGIAGMQVRVSFPQGLTLESIDFTTASVTGLTSQNPAKLTSPVKLTWYSGTSNSTYNGVLATLHFSVAQNATTPLTITLAAEPDDVADVQEENVPFILEDGSVSIGCTSHIPTVVERVEPGCETAGYSGDTVCSNCGVVLNTGISLAPLGHVWNKGEITTPATHMTEGVKTFTCERCEETKTEPVAKLTAHTFEKEVTTEQYLKSAATCTEAAVYYKSCECGEAGTETFTSGKALGHAWNDGEITTPATHMTEGVKTFTCERCEETKTEPVAKLTAHTFDKEAATEQYLKSAATCTAAAVYYKSCECGEKGTETFTSGEALGHKWNKGEITTPATHMTEGVKTYTCTVCKETKTEPVAKLTAHTFDKEVATEQYLKSAATCTDAAVYFKSCECGEASETETFTSGEALGHSWDDGEITTPATHEAEGEKTYTCTVCKETKTESIPKLKEEGPIEDFVRRFYSVCLGRENPGEDEIAYYMWEIKDNGMTGSEVASKFIFTEEFYVKNYCDRHYVEVLYKTFMGRVPDESEIAHWVWQLQQGMTREQVFNSFLSSAEFASFCTEAGIKQGSTIVFEGKGTRAGGRCTVDGCKSAEGYDRFVKRLYNVTLDRDPAQDELDAWVYFLIHGDHTAKTASHEFLFSEEFISHGYTDEVFVDYLYRAMMGRTPGADEVEYWVWRLSTGVTREAAFDEFAYSQEFALICQNFGINCQ